MQETHANCHFTAKVLHFADAFFFDQKSISLRMLVGQTGDFLASPSLLLMPAFCAGHAATQRITPLQAAKRYVK